MLPWPAGHWHGEDGSKTVVHDPRGPCHTVRAKADPTRGYCNTLLAEVGPEGARVRALLPVEAWVAQGGPLAGWEALQQAG
eukprot:3896519-Lingulodinium_polyedra.AAC.1